MSKQTQTLVNQLETRIEELTQTNLQLQNRVDQIEIERQINQILASTLDLKALNKQIVKTIKSLFGLYHVSIFLIDGKNQCAMLAEAAGKASRKMKKEGYCLIVDDESVIGWVSKNQAPYLSYSSSSTGPRDGQGTTQLKNLLLPKAQSEIVLPLIVQNSAIGVLDLQSVQKNAFEQNNIFWFQSLADQIAVAIQKAQLYAHVSTELDTKNLLLNVSQHFSKASSFNDVYDALAKIVTQAGADQCSLYMCDQLDSSNVPTYGQVVFTSASTLISIDDDFSHRFRLAKYPLLYESVRSRDALIIDNIKTDDRVTTEREFFLQFTANSVAIIPLPIRSDVLGLLSIEYQDQHIFTDHELDLYQTLSKQTTTALEHVRHIQRTADALERTQTLYRISDTLTTAAEPETTTGQQAILETVLGEYLHLLNLAQGSLMLYEPHHDYNKVYALFVDNQAVEPDLSFPIDKDLVFQQLLAKPAPLIIDDVQTHPLTKDNQEIRSMAVEAMLFIPLIMRGNVVGAIVADSTTKAHTFSQDDIEIGQLIADQLTIWLENRQLLEEAQYRAYLLQSAARVSQAASSILDVDELIASSVNLIRDHFNFYYVGLFLVDEARRWAVLQAGTGEAGRIQLERNHRLEIGGESMIGKSVANAQARIALDVGAETIHFKNPILPDTHSEMALPLISRDKVIGALTVQSVERGAFSAEDITLLQTMANQLANVIENASLFTQTQEALAEAETLYHVTQQLSSARDEDTVYELATAAIASSGVDSGAIYMYLEASSESNVEPVDQFIEQKAVWVITGQPAVPNSTRWKAADFMIEQLVPDQGTALIQDIDDGQLADQLYQALTTIGLTSLLVLPLSTYQTPKMGFLLAAYKSKDKAFSQNQIRFFTTVAQQTVIALENLRLLEASQKRAQREEIIRKITAKIRNAIDLDDVLRTTVIELSKVVGTTRGNITLGLTSSNADTSYTPEQTRTSDSNDFHNIPTNQDSSAESAAKNNKIVGNKR
jgi:GAF domain-containing protein